MFRKVHFLQDINAFKEKIIKKIMLTKSSKDKIFKKGLQRGDYPKSGPSDIVPDSYYHQQASQKARNGKEKGKRKKRIKFIARGKMKILNDSGLEKEARKWLGKVVMGGMQRVHTSTINFSNPDYRKAEYCLFAGYISERRRTDDFMKFYVVNRGVKWALGG